MATESTGPICKYNQVGFCKFGLMCRNRHIMEACQKTKCNLTSCQLRHPQKCRYFYIYGECKFKENCAYIHTNCRSTELINTVDELKKKHEVDVKRLEEKISQLQHTISILHSVLPSINPAERPGHVQPQQISPLPSHKLCISHNNDNTVGNHGFNSTDTIPQIDGCATFMDTIGDSFQCETCENEFET